MATPTRALSQKEQDIQMMLAAEVHLGTKNCNFQMERYVFKRRNDGTRSLSLQSLLKMKYFFLSGLVFFSSSISIYSSPFSFFFCSLLENLRSE